MKSKIVLMPDESSWIRVALDIDELVQAIREDSIRALVTEVLRSRFSAHNSFASICSDVTTSVLYAIAALVQKKTDAGLAVLINLDDVQATEARASTRAKQDEQIKRMYWTGESAKQVNI